MYYIKIIANFQKTVSNLLYSQHLYVSIPQSGIDLNTYPINWTKNWMIAYGVFGKVSSIDPQKTYDYHTAFDIKPTEVVYNVDLDMKRKKILKIALDKTKNNGLRAESTNETSTTLLDSFNGKRVVCWLTKKGTGGTPTVKASVSNYSATLTLSSALASQSNYTFRKSSEDATIHKVMYSPNFYDLDSIEFHTILIQESLFIYKRKIEMSKFAFSSYQKIFLDLRNAFRGGPFDKNDFLKELNIQWNPVNTTTNGP